MVFPEGLARSGKVLDGQSVRVRYAVLQLPSLALVALGAWALAGQGWISGPMAGLAVVLWIAKDAALYPLVGSAYEGDVDRRRAPVGCRGVVTRDLAPEGRVLVRGENWLARLVPAEAPSPGDSPAPAGDLPLPEGEAVEVLSRSGNLLLVSAVAKTLTGARADPKRSVV